MEKLPELPKLPPEMQVHIRAADRAFGATMAHADVHLTRAARTGKREDAGIHIDKAKECMRIATSDFFDVHAGQYWKALCPDSDRFVELLPLIGDKLPSDIQLRPVLEATAREVINQKTAEWMERVTREREKISADLTYGETVDRMLAGFRRQYAKYPKRRVTLLGRLAEDLVRAHLGQLIPQVTNASTYLSFITNLDFARIFIFSRISFLDDNDHKVAQELIEAEYLHIRAEAEHRLQGMAQSLPAPLSAELEQIGASATTSPKTSVRPMKLARWADLSIRFTSERQVQIFMPSGSEVLNYAEFGFEDQRSSLPNAAWITLRDLAESGGTMAAARDADWGKVEKRMQEIRKKLRNWFGLADDPLPFVPDAGYRAKFNIECGPSYYA